MGRLSANRVLVQLRASNWQELIYKKGAAGITKASVTIVFDNSDPSNSPPGMQGYKQITVTRQVCLKLLRVWGTVAYD